jgi:hypothetical protein
LPRDDLSFKQTNPVTLAYLGGDHLAAASLPAVPTNERLAAEHAAPLVSEAVARWQAAGRSWFVDKTPRSDSEFTNPGNQGEQKRMGLPRSWGTRLVTSWARCMKAMT